MTQLIYLPFRGEFDHKIMWHVPWVYQEKARVVCCEEGKECLFPTAEEIIYVPSLADRSRGHRTASDGVFLQRLRSQLGNTKGPLPGLPKNMKTLPRFTPTPGTEAGIETDILICPRRREVAPMRNWQHWDALVQCLSSHRVFAAGAPGSSVTELDCDASWNYARYLDATIEAMLSAKLVVATDTGLAHLALLCGRPLLVICHADGFSGPGSHPVKRWRFHAENHAGAPLMFQNHAWDSHERVARAAREFVATQEARTDINLSCPIFV